MRSTFISKRIIPKFDKNSYSKSLTLLLQEKEVLMGIEDSTALPIRTLCLPRNVYTTQGHTARTTGYHYIISLTLFCPLKMRKYLRR
jgi:hypothetical protein